MKHLLIVDDELGSRQSLHAIFSGQYKVMLADSAKAALAQLNTFRADLVLLDYMMPEMDGITLLKEIQTRYPDIPFVMVSASSTVRPVVDAMRAGAFDFVSKPFDLQEIRAVVARALEHSGLRRKVEVLQNEIARRFPLNAIVGKSIPMQKVHEVVRRAANSDATILISGESGTGKELIARQLHSLSSRCDDPFIPVHCGAIPDTLMESELFGHEKGAFTGADRRKPGRFDMAGSGTIFFDEVSEMSLSTQVKLLRVIQEREYMRVGGTEVLRTNARIITASNKDLMKEVREQRFREDLFYRLNVVPVAMPPVRDRRDDIPLLVEYFIHLIRQNMIVDMEEVTPEAMERLVAYDWPGNVRELRNVVERAMVLYGHHKALPLESLPPEFLTTNSPPVKREVSVDMNIEPLLHGLTLHEAVNEFERKLVMRALAEANGVQTRAAEILGTTRRILKYRIDKLRIEDSANGIKSPQHPPSHPSSSPMSPKPEVEKIFDNPPGMDDLPTRQETIQTEDQEHPVPQESHTSEAINTPDETPSPSGQHAAPAADAGQNTPDHAPATSSFAIAPSHPVYPVFASSSGGVCVMPDVVCNENLGLRA